MKRITLTDFSGGIINNVNPDLVPDNAFEDIVDMEYRAGEGLTKRSQEILYSDLAGLTDDLGRNVLPIQSFVVWYPDIIPNNAIDNKVYIIQSRNRIVVYYRKGVNWSKTCILEGSNKTATYYVSRSKVLIADGIHTVRQLYVDTAKEIKCLEIGLEAPKTILQVSDSLTDNVYLGINESNRGMDIEKGNILQYCYTVENKYGAESNPSPITTFTKLMYKYKDWQYPNGIRYVWYKTRLQGLSIKGYSEEIKDTLKYYNIYRRDIEYVEGTIYKNFVLVARIPIKKDAEYQDYIDISNQNLKDMEYTGESIITDKISMTGNVIFVADKRDKPIKFPYKYDAYLDISILNNNDIDYVNAVIALKIPWITNKYNIYSLLYNLEDNKDKVRFYFEDCITPLQCLYQTDEDNETTGFLVNVPHLDRNKATHIYFCWSLSDGVIDDHMKNFNAGEPLSIFNDNETLEWLTNPVRDISQKIYSYVYDNWEESDKLPNKADENNLGFVYDDTNPDAEWFPTIGKKEYTRQPVLFMDSKAYPIYNYSFKPIAKTGTENGNYYVGYQWLSYVKNNYRLEARFNLNLYHNAGSTVLDSHLLSIGLKNERNKFMRLNIKVLNDKLFFYLETRAGSDPIIIYNGDGEICLSPEDLGLPSFNPDYSLTLDVYVIFQNDVCYASFKSDMITYNEIKKMLPSYEDTLISGMETNEARVGFSLDITKTDTDLRWNYDIVAFDYSTDTNLINSLDMEKAILCRLLGITYFKDWIGCNHWQDTRFWGDNINISQEYHKLENPNAENTVLRWSNIEGNTFPVLNYYPFDEKIEAIIPQPAYLPMQYINTIIVFTRNSINRIVLSNELNQMAEMPANIIKEYSNLGLYAPNSLVETPQGLIWLSEGGVMLWNRDGINNISKNKINFNIYDKDAIIACYYPLLNQYILFVGERERIAYVYHLDYDCWTKFTNFEIKCTANLNYGTEDINSMLIVRDDGIWEYNPAMDKVRTNYLRTKRYRLDYIKPVRFRLLCTQYPEQTKVMTRNIELDGYLSNEVEVDKYKWVLIPNGIWGEYLQFYFKNIDQLIRLEIDLKETL